MYDKDGWKVGKNVEKASLIDTDGIFSALCMCSV